MNTLERNIDYWAGVHDALGFNTVWSVYNDKDISETSDVVIPEATGPVEVVLNDIKVFAVNGTALELYKAAERLNKKAKDDHHTFIEGFEKIAYNRYAMITGS
jgi:hypothetical protein